MAFPKGQHLMSAGCRKKTTTKKRLNYNRGSLSLGNSYFSDHVQVITLEIQPINSEFLSSVSDAATTSSFFVCCQNKTCDPFDVFAVALRFKRNNSQIKKQSKRLNLEFWLSLTCFTDFFFQLKMTKQHCSQCINGIENE